MCTFFGHTVGHMTMNTNIITMSNIIHIQLSMAIDK